MARHSFSVITKTLPALVFIGIGSNIGDRMSHCTDAVSRILGDERAHLVALSSIYLTSALSLTPQDDYYNAAAAVRWSDTPEALLLFLSGIESAMGRKRILPKGPRIIDLDILLFGDLVLRSEHLTIPHPELHRRAFALGPCVEIDPGIVHPALRLPLREFLTRIDPPQKIVRLGTFPSDPEKHGEELASHRCGNA